MTTKTTQTACDRTFNEVLAFGMNDAAGRAIGVRLEVYRSVFEDAPADARMWRTMPAGTYFIAFCQPMRDGARFGAATANKGSFATEAEAIAAARKAAESTRKRYAKKFPG